MLGGSPENACPRTWSARGPAGACAAKEPFPHRGRRSAGQRWGHPAPAVGCGQASCVPSATATALRCSRQRSLRMTTRRSASANGSRPTRASAIRHGKAGTVGASDSLLGHRSRLLPARRSHRRCPTRARARPTSHVTCAHHPAVCCSMPACRAPLTACLVRTMIGPSPALALLLGASRLRWEGQPHAKRPHPAPD